MEQKAMEAAASAPKATRTRRSKITKKEVSGEPMETPKAIEFNTAEMYNVKIRNTRTGKEVIKKLPKGTLQFIYPAQFDGEGRIRPGVQKSIELLEDVPGLAKPSKKPCKDC